MVSTLWLSIANRLSLGFSCYAPTSKQIQCTPIREDESHLFISYPLQKYLFMLQDCLSVSSTKNTLSSKILDNKMIKTYLLHTRTHSSHAAGQVTQQTYPIQSIQSISPLFHIFLCHERRKRQRDFTTQHKNAVAEL